MERIFNMDVGKGFSPDTPRWVKGTRASYPPEVWRSIANTVGVSVDELATLVDDRGISVSDVTQKTGTPRARTRTRSY